MEDSKETPFINLPKPDLDYVLSVVGDVLGTKFSHKEEDLYIFPLPKFTISLEFQKREFTLVLSFTLHIKNNLKSSSLSAYIYQKWFEYFETEDLEETLPNFIKKFIKLADHVTVQ